MWIVLPLAPIVIALFLITAGVFGEIQSNLDTINMILTICNTLVFIGIAIYNLTRDYISIVKKIFSSVSCCVLGIVSAFVLKFFLSELASIDMGILGVLEFGFVGIAGGCITLMIVCGCIMACCWFSD